MSSEYNFNNPDAIQEEVDRLTQALRNEVTATRIVDLSIDLMCPAAKIIEDAITHYMSMTANQRARHDYAPRPANPVQCWIDDPTYRKFLEKAQGLKMSPEHYAFFCITRYLAIDEPLEIVEVKTGPKTKGTRIRRKEPEE